MEMNNASFKIILGLIFLIVFQINALAQQDKVIQLSGIVISAGDTIVPVPYANIKVKNSYYRGTASNYEGFFSLPVKPNDTLIFSALGFEDAQFEIPDTLAKSKYSIIQSLRKDTITLVEAVIYPWPSKEDFKRAFLELEIPDDDITVAKKNIAREKIRELAKTLPLDGKETASIKFREDAKRYYYMGQQPPNNLANPFAWIQFFKMLKNGELNIQK